MKKMELATVSVDLINFQEKKFKLAPLIYYESLLPSLRRVGLISPPLLKEEEAGLVIVSGWKRVLACRELRMKTIPAFVASSGTSDLELLTRALEENLYTRPLSLAEKAEAVDRLRRYGLAEERIIAEYLPRLSLPAKYQFFELLLRVAESNDQSWKEFLHQTEVPLEALDLLLSFLPEERKLLYPYLQVLSFSRRREMIFNLQAIAVREKLAIPEILKQGETEAIYGPALSGSRRQAEALAQWLRKRRYPLMTAWEEEWQKAKKTLDWPEEIHLASDPSFESGELRFSFSCRSAEEFLAQLEKLRPIALKPGFRRLFRRSL